MSPAFSGPIRVLLIEDNSGDAHLARTLLMETGGFVVDWVSSLADAALWLACHTAHVILLDLSLPDAVGLDTMDRLRRMAPDAAVVVCTGLDDEAVGIEAVKHGFQDYLIKGQSDGHLMARTVHHAIERKAIERERQQTAERMKRALLQTVKAMSLTLEMRDPYTAGHQRRVSQLAVAIGKRMGLDEDQLEGLQTGALIHDLGKINVPSDFLSRPGKLSDAAFGVVRSHSQVGADIVAEIEFPWPVAKMIRQHHERLDGTGYPDGAKGDEIILESRILAVADVVEAISSHRPYRPALGVETALREIRHYAGSRYDPKVVEACVAVIEDGGDVLNDGSDTLPEWV